MSAKTFKAAGGANFIGASAYILKMKEEYLGVDWGQGVSGSPESPQYDGPLNNLLLTHAHSDHLGKVPVALRRWPNLKIFATRETKELAKVTWGQTLYCSRQRERLGQITPPPFTADEALAAEKAIIVVEPDRTITLDGGIEMTPIWSGHILGAVSYLVYFEGEYHFFSGDICYHNSFFVPGAPLFKLDRCRLLVRESVYVNEDFEDRQKLTDDFIQAAKAVLNRGGQLLVPALSIHRTQEMYVTFVKAGVGPVFVDGSHKATEVYRQFALRGEEMLTNIPRFGSHRERRQLLRSEMPAVIIASSGMVYENTLSAMWAENLLFREKNAIFTVNYQDPCGQGYQLVHSKRGQFMRFNGSIIRRLCEIRHFPLSAHMGKTDGQKLEERLNPDVVVYAHGEDSQIETYLRENPSTSSRMKIKAEVGKEVVL